MSVAAVTDRNPGICLGPSTNIVPGPLHGVFVLLVPFRPFYVTNIAACCVVQTIQEVCALTEMKRLWRLLCGGS